MNINWKARLKSKTFWVSIVSAIVLLTQQLGLNIFPDNWSDLLNTTLTIFILLGIIIDPSTAGISDMKDAATMLEKENEIAEEELEFRE